MLDRESQRFDLKEVWLAEQSIDINTSVCAVSLLYKRVHSPQKVWA